ncbi:LamG-like jellyroll fold domain-containing protein [Myceligenerans pegani]|uniref:LamG domain-containing protein n=1 Tax=Myceligenerans pegani TaxID=2776917 RepID=A0ABR9MYW2_9MICO|nr:LamG-like jellyroll fold domain-containing protein [Myceligenerans sp. TRM 65318]MBE1876585.1 LamG domain-containing protein [Myceligenerans sp. TRM 65318]MBE3018856.1 LamG domain-containing protein [Myceligenerans sp. TRM 65318]
MNRRIYRRLRRLGLGLVPALLTALLWHGPGLPDDVSAYDVAVLRDDPEVYWTMASADEGVEADIGGSRITGTYTGGPSSTTLPNGDVAAVFDGATQYFEASDAPELSPTTTGEITIEAWMRPDTLQFTNSQSSGYVNWMGKGEEGQHEYVSRMYSLDNTESRPNRISGYSFNLSGGLGAGSYFQDPIAAGDWIHYALVINTVDVSPDFPNGYTKIYRDGVLRDQDDLSIRGMVIEPGRSVAPFRAGTRDFASWFEGAIGKIAIYDHELSQEQLAEHHEAMFDERRPRDRGAGAGTRPAP